MLCHTQEAKQKFRGMLETPESPETRQIRERLVKKLRNKTPYYILSGMFLLRIGNSINDVKVESLRISYEEWKKIWPSGMTKTILYGNTTKQNHKKLDNVRIHLFF